MKMKKISAANIQEALTLARRELGDDAVLLETKKAQGGGVIVTFAIDAPDESLFDPEESLFSGTSADILPFTPEIQKPATPKIELDHPALGLIAEAFEYHSVPLALAQRLLNTLYKIRLKPDALIEVAETALADALTENLAFQPIATRAMPKRALMFVGPHGAGKSSTIAKLATELTVAGQQVVLISTDNERMGGAEALQKLAEILKCDYYPCEKRQQLKLLLQQYLGKAWVLVDSAGANIYEFAAMKALGEFASLQDVEPILVCPAGMDADEAQEMASVFNFLNIERMIVTRVDAIRRLKSVFAALSTGGYALSNLTNSAVPSDACQPFSPVALSRLMLRHARERITH